MMSQELAGKKMRAIVIREPGAPEVLQEISVPVPGPGESEVLIQVHAAGVNRPDVLQRLGMYPVPADADPLPGLEVAGEVVATGANASRWQSGDKVMALCHGGGYAEYCRVNENHCLPVPANLSMVEAAAIPETYFTVWYNLFMRANLDAGETLLVHGGSSGIGTTAIQLAKASGASVITTAGTDEKCDFCVDLVLDMVAGPYMQKNMNALGRDGRYVIIAFLQGPKAELDMRQVLGKRLTITGSTLRPQSTAKKAEIAADLENHVLPWLESGAVRPIIDATFPLDDAAKAHALMESSQHMGKIVLDILNGDHLG